MPRGTSIIIEKIRNIPIPSFETVGSGYKNLNYFLANLSYNNYDYCNIVIRNNEEYIPISYDETSGISLSFTYITE